MSVVIINGSLRAGKMAQELRPLAALPENSRAIELVYTCP